MSNRLPKTSLRIIKVVYYLSGELSVHVMHSIKTHCTIVKLKVPDGKGGCVAEDSGWDERQVIAAITEANAIWTRAKVKFEAQPTIKTLEVDGPKGTGAVDRDTFDLIRAKVGATGFIAGEVRVVFIKIFSGPYNGLSAEDWCFAAVRHPVVERSRGWVLAHELGHLLGLADECKNGTTPMFYNWFYEAGSKFTMQEITLVSRHPHIKTSESFKGARPDKDCPGQAH